jgi:hypothetical protein
LLGNFRTSRVDVQIGDEKDRHAQRPGS